MGWKKGCVSNERAAKRLESTELRKVPAVAGEMNGCRVAESTEARGATMELMVEVRERDKDGVVC